LRPKLLNQPADDGAEQEGTAFRGSGNPGIASISELLEWLLKNIAACGHSCAIGPIRLQALADVADLDFVRSVSQTPGRNGEKRALLLRTH